MFKIFFGFGFICLISLNALVADDFDTLPEQFTVTERYFSWTTVFDIETPDHPIGKIHRKFLSWDVPVQYDFYDTENELRAQGKMRWFTFGAVFDVTDNLGNSLGHVKEKIFNLLPTFEIYSHTGEMQTTAKFNFFKTTCTIKDPLTGLKIATLSRPYFTLNSQWTVTITDAPLFAAKNISPTLFMIVMAFQTDQEHWENRNSYDSMISAHMPTYLDSLQDSFEDASPSENDFKKMEAIAENLLINDEPEKTADNMILLLEMDEFSPEEKMALLLLIKDK